MAEKKYVGTEALIRLIAQLKAGFATLNHQHKLEDIADYTVDSALSGTSANPVQNKVLKSKFDETETKLAAHSDNSEIHVTLEEKEAWSNIVDGYATEEYVKNLYTTLNSNTVLAFYCIEDVTIVTNGISKIYPANSNVEVRLVEGDSFEIVPTSDNSILSRNLILH